VLKFRQQRDLFNFLFRALNARIFPLFSYHKYSLYENENRFSNVVYKLQKTKTVHFVSFEEFQRYKEKHNILVLDIDLSLIEQRIRNGVILFCVIVDNKIVHTNWLALNEKAKQVVDPWPMKIDWKNEACWGQAQTNINFRGQGLYSNVYLEISNFLLEKGISRNKFTIKERNIASKKAMSKFSPNLIGKGVYIKILFWKFYYTINQINN
jgi:hypothetical protein